MGRVKCQKEDELDRILEGVFLELDWMDYPPFPLPENQQIEAVFRMKIPSVGSSFPGIPVSGSRDPCCPGCTINKFTKYLENFWNQGRTKIRSWSPEHFKSPNCQILPFRIKPIDTDTRLKMKATKKKSPLPGTSRYRHMTSGSIFKMFFFWGGCIKR